MLFALSACGQSEGGYRVKSVLTLVEQEYSIAFRTGDYVGEFVPAAIKVLMADGTVDALAQRWFGSRIISFESDANAIEKLKEKYEIYPRSLTIGVDTNSFPMAYVSEGSYWGFDIEFANVVCELLGWSLQIQPINKEDVFVELSSGNIDCAWGGIVLDQKELDNGRYEQFGPYVKNDIVIAVRSGEFIYNALMLSGKSMAMCSTTEAMEALQSNPKLEKRLNQVTRLAGGTTECFRYLYSGKVDAVLTDSTAMYYFNCH